MWTVQQAKDLSNACFLVASVAVVLLAPDLNPLLGPKLKPVFVATLVSCVVGDLLFTQVYPPDEGHKPITPLCASKGAIHVITGFVINVAVTAVVAYHLLLIK